MTSKRSTKYNVISSLSTYKEKLNSYSGSDNQLYSGHCDDINTIYSAESEHNINKNCEKAMMFLNHLVQHDSYMDEGCTYLYYWLYAEVLNKNQSIDIAIRLYEWLLTKYDDENGTETFKNHSNYLSRSMLENLIKLIKLYDHFNKFKQVSESASRNCECARECVNWYTDYVNECHAGSDVDFCNELENFRELYNGHMITESDCHDVQKVLPSVKRIDFTLVILIPLVTVLIISFIFFIMYKFTPFGSLIFLRFKRKKKMRNNIDQEIFELPQSTQMANGDFEDNYRISYKSLLNS
ncbi:PIR Superfamily Protein [Plasmodium ovale wallikeri]|uniref:PIR Superfamily Protein n=2 Tax=Plasmodium ovale TaxID=36330 RepID=A0A1A8YHY5_PLAOA|nr:PIR Superfamily Protein [Plasmodium ovale wallikeri]SBT57199.1 PIR Superfamily Protein [Plasmodium ovale wallikeri]SBT73945.1 PIR protein [Plasmodium ovale]